MKTQQALTLITLLFPSLLMFSCVSSLLQEKAPSFSKEIQFKAPANTTGTSFTQINSSIYPAWKNSKTGNVISIISDCNDNNSISLSTLHQLITESIEQPKLIKQQQLTFKDKPALLYLTEGNLDGQAIEIKSLSFKRKNCGYVSSLSGRPKTLDLDQKSFDDFNESIKFE